MNRMASKPQRYPGHFVTKNGQELSFNLYPNETVKVEETSKNFMDNMKRNHLLPLRKLFATAGLNLHGFEFYSPKYYNFEGDSIDLVISIGNKAKLIKFIKDNTAGIQKLLSGNQSRDGYMALTAGDVDEVIDKINEKSDVDAMVVTFILRKYPLDEYDDYYDLLDEEDEEERS